MGVGGSPMDGPDLQSRVCQRRGFIVGSYGHGWVRVDVLAGLLDED